MAKYRLLSLDGGGIYGLFTALMLRDLAEKNKNFLKDKQISAFAGTSAGALISLLLACEDNPRDAIMSGKIEKFFKSARLHGNSMDPMDAFTSLFGLSSWCGGKDMWHLLDEHFGNLTLGDLKHNVLIMTFDMSSGPEDNPRQGWSARIFHNFHIKGHSLNEKVSLVAYAAACPVTVRPVVRGLTDGCIFAMSPTLPAFSQLMAIATKKAEIMGIYQKEAGYRRNESAPQYSFSNSLDGSSEDENSLGESSEEKMRKAFLKHAAAIRKVINQLSDQEFINSDETAYLLAVFNPDRFKAMEKPALRRNIYSSIKVEQQIVEIMSKLLYTPFTNGFQEPGGRQEKHVEPENLKKEIRPEADKLYSGHAKISLDIKFHLNTFKNIEVLSMGVGSDEPTYFMKNFNLGALNLNWFPTNAMKNFWYPPAAYLLYSPGTYSADYVANNLLDTRYYRCDPELIGWPVPPVVICLFLARFPLWRDFIVAEIEKSFKRAGNNMAACERWLEEKKWFQPQGEQ